MGKREDANKIIGWKAIGLFLGMTEWGAKMAFHRAGIKLPKLGARGRTSPVYMLRDQLLSNAIRVGLSTRKCS